MKIQMNGEILEVSESYARRAIAFKHAVGIPEAEDDTAKADSIPNAEDEAKPKKAKKANKDVETCL